MRGKVISDGSTVGTRVVAEDGREIREVTSVTWRHHEAGQLPVLDVQIGLYGIEAEGEMRLLGAHPIEGGLREVKRIIFADGTCWPDRPPQIVALSGIELMRSIEIKVTMMAAVRVRTWLAAKVMALAGLIAGCEVQVAMDQTVDITTDRVAENG